MAVLVLPEAGNVTLDPVGKSRIAIDKDDETFTYSIKKTWTAFCAITNRFT